LACGGVTSVFNKSHGLCAIGSTKSGGMLEFGEFYQPMADGKTIGQAYLEWFKFIADGGFTPTELCWYYGMTLLGDPFLRPVLQADVCPTAVICPERYYAQCTTVVPRVQVWNAGKDTASFAVTCSMTLNRQTYYASLESVFGLVAGAKETVDLDPVFLESGCYTVKVRTTMSGDENPLNDTFVSSVTVAWGWHEVADVPIMPSGRAVKDGGCLAYDAGTDAIYASKGYKTGDFYKFALPADTWATLASIPFGGDGKQVYKGSTMCADGNGKLYLTKGNNTRGFWEYDAAMNTWTQKTDVPFGESGKRVKQGAGLAWAGGAAYLLKGYRNEFYKYNPANNSWTALTAAPAGWHMKWDAGSWLVSASDTLLYAFKGKYHEFYKYYINQNAWSAPLHAMPIPGRSGNKKAKDGSCAAWFDGNLYAFKGGNTTEFWHYLPLADSWVPEADIPLYGNSGRRKAVLRGGALAAYPTAAYVYALKGNKCFEFWRYVPGPTDGDDAVERYASGGGRVVASGGPTFDGEQPLTDGLEASKPRWNWQGTMVCYSKTDTLTEREQIYQCHYGLPIPEQRVVDMDEDCEEPVYSPSGQYIAFQLDDTVSGFYQLCVTSASGGGGGGGMDGASEESVGSADLSSAATVVSPNGDNAPNARLGILSSKSAVENRSAISAGPGASGSVATLGQDWQSTTAAEDHCSPEWSPNGQWLCYERDDDSGYTQVWRVPAFGGTEEQLTSGNSDHLLPSYLNVNEIVCMLSPNDGYDVVAKVNVSTHQTTVVSNFQTDHDRPNPSWNGAGVVAEALDDSCNTQIVKIPIWLGSESWLTSGTSDIMEPDYGQDNRSVFAVRWTGITSQIVCVDAQNGGYTAVTDSLAIRDNPDALYNPNTQLSTAVYEREAWDPENLLFGGGRRKHGAGVYLSKFRKPHVDGSQSASLGVFALDKAKPNPATDRVTIRWTVPVEADVSLRLYNAAGQMVKVLADGRTKPGAYTSVWNGADARGRRLANGIYFCTLDNGSKRISRKLVLTE
ncbi:MAG: T9SS type A sorting domain-containing protein, partial [candidate division WOR-3 bacterium]|nr:T9SS type A sorting domain-containing protein [candidate division WOR-3 bacterium]